MTTEFQKNVALIQDFITSSQVGDLEFTTRLAVELSFLSSIMNTIETKLVSERDPYKTILTICDIVNKRADQIGKELKDENERLTRKLKG